MPMESSSDHPSSGGTKVMPPIVAFCAAGAVSARTRLIERCCLVLAIEASALLMRVRQRRLGSSEHYARETFGFRFATAALHQAWRAAAVAACTGRINAARPDRSLFPPRPVGVDRSREGGIGELHRAIHGVLLRGRFHAAPISTPVRAGPVPSRSARAGTAGSDATIPTRISREIRRPGAACGTAMQRLRAERRSGSNLHATGTAPDL
jgi:hypothetical protein